MRRLLIAAPLLLGSVPALIPAAALAGDDWVPPVTDAVTRAECGSCHMAFQPAFLPAASWRVMMGTLKDHFGDDASLPPETTAHIAAYLEANAADSPRGMGRKYLRRLGPDAAPQRITEMRWFVHEHDFPDRVWKRPDVVTRSNCAACHRGAEQGLYEDD